MEQTGSESPRKASDITGLLQDLESGRPAAFDRLVEVAYPELRRLAHWHCGRERPSNTLQCTAIVHEAWIRLAEGERTSWRDRAHFFAFASRLMRSILIDYARARKSIKRGGGTPALDLIVTDAALPPLDLDVLALNEALNELEKLDPLQGRIVELRYFTGLSIPETAMALSVSESTVKREWNFAKTWIRRRMLEGEASG